MLSFCYKIIILFKNKTLLVLLSYIYYFVIIMFPNNFIVMNLNHQHHLLQLMTHFIMTYKSHFNIILSVFFCSEVFCTNHIYKFCKTLFFYNFLFIWQVCQSSWKKVLVKIFLFTGSTSNNFWKIFCNIINKNEGMKGSFMWMK